RRDPDPARVRGPPDYAGRMKAAVMDEVIGGRDDADVFERARRAGFAGVEVDLRRARRSARASAGLAIPSLVLGEHNHGGIADADPAVARAAAHDVRDAIERAAELGADVVLVPFFLDAELRDEAAVDRCAAAFRELCPVAAELVRK